MYGSGAGAFAGQEQFAAHASRRTSLEMPLQERATHAAARGELEAVGQSAAPQASPSDAASPAERPKPASSATACSHASVPLWEKRSLPGFRIDTTPVVHTNGKDSGFGIRSGSTLSLASRSDAPGDAVHTPSRRGTLSNLSRANLSEQPFAISPTKKELRSPGALEPNIGRGCSSCRPAHTGNRTPGWGAQSRTSTHETRPEAHPWTTPTAAAAAAAAHPPRTPASAPPIGAHAVNDLYKTELCRSWIETGACRYGSKCQFAHGQEELRPLPRHPKYKTKVCKNFAENGSCPYGSRCRFIHERTRTGSFEGLEPELLAVVTAGSSATPRKLPIFEQLHHSIEIDTARPLGARPATPSRECVSPERQRDRFFGTFVAEPPSPPSPVLSSPVLSSPLPPNCSSSSSSSSSSKAAAVSAQTTKALANSWPENPLLPSPGSGACLSLPPSAPEATGKRSEPSDRSQLSPARSVETPNSRPLDATAISYWNWWSAEHSPVSRHALEAAKVLPMDVLPLSVKQERVMTWHSMEESLSPITPANIVAGAAAEELPKSVSTTWGSARSLWTAFSAASMPLSATPSTPSPSSSSSSACLSALSSTATLSLKAESGGVADSKERCTAGSQGQGQGQALTPVAGQNTCHGKDAFTWIH